MSTPDPIAQTAGQVRESLSWSHLRLERHPAYWHVTFDHPPINTITATTVSELSELIDLIEREADLNVVVFASANSDFFLAHYDTERDPARPRRSRRAPPGCTRGSI
jgi:enoyl-CoA hydratase/carnithine racemase